MKSDQYQISWDDEIWLKWLVNAGTDPTSSPVDSQHEGVFSLYTQRAGESTAEGLGAMKVNRVNQGVRERRAENGGVVNDELQQQQQDEKWWSKVEREQPRSVSLAQRVKPVVPEPNDLGKVRGYDLNLGFVASERPVNLAGVYRRPGRELQAGNDEAEFVGMDEYVPTEDQQGVNRQEVSRIINERLAELRVYVLESDITDAQQAVKSIVEQASF